MDDRERLDDLERQLKLLVQTSEKVEKRLAYLESTVSGLQARMDRVQSQLSGERQLRKWIPRW